MLEYAVMYMQHDMQWQELMQGFYPGHKNCDDTFFWKASEFRLYALLIKIRHLRNDIEITKNAMIHI